VYERRVVNTRPWWHSPKSCHCAEGRRSGDVVQCGAHTTPVPVRDPILTGRNVKPEMDGTMSCYRTGPFDPKDWRCATVLETATSRPLRLTWKLTHRDTYTFHHCFLLLLNDRGLFLRM